MHLILEIASACFWSLLSQQVTCILPNGTHKPACQNASSCTILTSARGKSRSDSLKHLEIPSLSLSWRTHSHRWLLDAAIIAQQCAVAEHSQGFQLPTLGDGTEFSNKQYFSSEIRTPQKPESNLQSCRKLGLQCDIFCLNVREQCSSSAAVMLLNNTHFPLMTKAAHSVFYQSHTVTKDNIIFIRQ